MSAEEYEVDGEIEQTLFKRDGGGVESVEKSKFTVFVNDCSWLIKSTDLDNSGKPVFVRETACTNGAEIYEVGGRINTKASAYNVATVVSNSVPVGQMDDYFVCHIWQMFASGCYFANLTTNWLTPAYDVNASVTADPKLKREAKWQLVNGPGSLPLSVVYFQGPFHVTDATYTATGMTNAGELQIPSGFVFERRFGDRFSTRFAPGPILPGETNSAYRVRKRAVATVTAVRPACSRSELAPAIKGKTMILDRRLAQMTNPIPMMYYKSRDGVQSVSVEEAKKMNLMHKHGTQKRLSESTVKVVIYVLLLLPTAAFLLFVWLNRKRK